MALIHKRPARWVGRLGLALASYRLWRRFTHGHDDNEQAVEAATPAPLPDEVVPSDLTSPGTVADPQLEQRRAEEALARERESRASTMTKFDELRLEQETERHEHAAIVADLAPPGQLELDATAAATT